VTKALIRGSLSFFAFRFLAFAATLPAADQPAPAPPGKLVDVGGPEHSPCVLAGQSMGGLFVRSYQHEHPDQVVGMVLVDTYELGIGINGKRVDLREVPKEQLQANLPPPSSYRSLHSRPTCAPRLNKLPEPVPTIPVWLERTFFETLEFNKGPAMMESWRSAYTILHQASLTPDSLAGLPLVVLTRENVIEGEPKQQTELARLSRNSRKEMAVGSPLHSDRAT